MVRIKLIYLPFAPIKAIISFVLNLDLDLGNSSNRIFGFVTNA
jgi:hypothetical protein